MCGISGFLGTAEASTLRICEKINHKIAHRGPDDAEVRQLDSQNILGHRRLSIIDLSKFGHQPMLDPTGSFVIAFNGEIYNYQILRGQLISSGKTLRGHSDTEVLLTGLIEDYEKYLSKLQGMFSFCFYSLKDHKFLMARDPVGIKPLYFVNSKIGIFFASEAKALLGVEDPGAKTSRRGLHSFLTFGCLNQNNSIHENIQQLPPGSKFSFNADKINAKPLQHEKYWNLPTNVVSDENFAIETLKTLIPKAVEDHLIADVPVGIFLSSGIDSSIIGGIAGEIHPGIEAFTVCFGDHKEFDEDRIAMNTAKLFHLKHHRIVIPESDALEGFEAWLAALDQPSIDGLNTFLISRAVRKNGIKVALSGLGADELFGGYPSFREVPLWSKRLSWTRWIPRWVLSGAGRILGLRKGLIASEKFVEALTSGGSVRELYRIRRGLFGKQRIAQMMGEGEWNEFAHLPAECEDSVREVQRLEFQMYMGNMLLRDTDVCSMAHGLEVRVPFLDQRIVDFALSLDGSLIAPKNKPGKYLLRQSMAKYLRDEILHQPKRGFVFPVGKWLKGPLRSYAQELLNGITCIAQEEVQKIWRAFLIEKEGPLQTRVVGLLALAKVESRTRSENCDY